MPNFGMYRKSPVMLGDLTHKAKSLAGMAHMGAIKDGFLGSDNRHNARNIPLEGLPNMIKKLLERKKSLDEEEGAVERQAEKA